MKNYNRALLAACMSIGLLTGCKTVYDTNADKSIVVLYDNDVHCAIDGYASIAGLKDAIADTAYVALVSSGDYLQGGTAGAISNGQYVADVMRNVGYDAITLGNHEFDYSVERMQELLKSIGVPVTCVNFADMQGRRQYLPYVMKKMGGRKVAFIGATTPSTLQTEAYSFFDDDDVQHWQFQPEKVYALVQEQVNAVRKKGADYVIVLSHLGEEETPENIDSHGLIANTTGINAVLDGHSHSVIPCETVQNKDGKPVLITETGTQFAHIGKLLIDRNGKISTELIPLDKITQKKASVVATLDSISVLSKEMTEKVVCHSDFPIAISDVNGIRQVRNQETNAGDLVADAYRIVTGAEIGLSNGGGIRNDLKAGDLTYGQIVSLLPYDNYVSVVNVSGSQLLEVLEACTAIAPAEDGDFPQTSGMKYTINLGQKPRVTDVMVLEKNSNEYKPLDTDRVYQVATIDYCITKGGFKELLKKNEVIKPNIIRYNDCLVKYATEILGGRIPKEYEKPQGRITIK